MEQNNFSLLSQEEIDSLVNYLRKGNHKIVESKVLNQESIDKLILMMQSFREVTADNQNVRAVSCVLSGDRTWSLEMSVNDSRGYVELYVTDGNKHEKITPESFAAGCFLGDNSQWGFAISPSMFCDVASVFGIRFTKETYEQVVRQFAKINYGSPDYPVPSFYLADNQRLSINLIEKM